MRPSSRISTPSSGSIRAITGFTSSDIDLLPPAEVAFLSSPRPTHAGSWALSLPTFKFKDALTRLDLGFGTDDERDLHESVTLKSDVTCALQSLRSIVSARLRGPPAGFHIPPLLSILSFWPHLEHLHLEHYVAYDFDASLPFPLPSLRTLRLSDVQGDPSSLVSLAPTLYGLEVVASHWCGGVSSNLFSTPLPLLRELTLVHCRELGPFNLVKAPFDNGFPALRSLKMYGGADQGERAVQALNIVAKELGLEFDLA